MVVEIDIQKKGDKFDIFIGDDNGGSGISLKGESVDEVINDMLPYLRDYLENCESEE